MSWLLRGVQSVGGAFEFATVLPVPARLTRSLSGRVLTALPVVGAALGALAVGVAWLATRAYPSAPALTGLAAVTAVVLATRGLHIDGLSDTADALGCYGPPERALAVMRDGSAGPFGVAAVVIVLGAQSLSFGLLAHEHSWLALGIAVAAGRVSAVLACRQGVPAAEANGFGARVAGSQPGWTVALWAVALTAASIWTDAAHRWHGPLAVAVSLAAGAALVAHCVRRFGGITGDVLGATVEVTTALAALGLAAGS